MQALKKKKKILGVGSNVSMGYNAVIYSNYIKCWVLQTQMSILPNVSDRMICGQPHALTQVMALI